ncbi:MAG TPA: RDD family protein [Mycobacteriales bacterium]|nr:RDD family protein [Mycobacteriales bacterium]
MTNPQDPFSSPGEEQPLGYGSPPPPGYGTPPPPAYGQVPPPPAYGAPMPQLAGWGSRVQSALVDWFLPFVVADVVYYASKGLGIVLFLAAFAWVFYNRYLEGTTGQSYGKKLAGTRLVREQDGQLVGAGLAIGRMFVHIIDGLPCYLGYLWPLWDAKKQTFADKILNTLVIKA